MTCLPSLQEPPEAGPAPAVAPWAAAPSVRALASRCAPDAGRAARRWEGLTLVVAEAGAFCYHDHGYTRLIEPGSVIVGRAGDEWACTHEHGGGDACRAFQFGQEAEEAIGRAFGREVLAGGVLAPDAGLAALYQRTRPGEGFEEGAYVLALAALRGLGAGAAVPPSLRRADRDRAHAAAQLIETRHAEPLALADLAAAVGTSPFHFLRAFKAALGLTPHQFLVRTRLRHAARLLLETDLPVTEVAYAVGFGDLSTFTHAFKAATGRPPGAWRKNPQA